MSARNVFADLAALPDIGEPGRLDLMFGAESERPAEVHVYARLIIADATPALKRAIVLLAAGRDRDALVAASEACHEAPGRAEPHYVYGQVWARLGEQQNAERAFAAAIQLAPDWADAWVNFGVARYRRGSLDDATAAMREALHRAPGHAAASANLVAFLRLAGVPPPGRATQPAIGSAEAGVRVLDVADPARALGLAVGYLMNKDAFAELPFRHWSYVLNGQIRRGHFRIFVGSGGKTCGFVGWSFATQAAAESWLAGNASPTSAECSDGDCVIVNAWAADTARVHRLMVDEARQLFADKRIGFFKRLYPDGRLRLRRLPINVFVRRHAERTSRPLTQLSAP